MLHRSKAFTLVEIIIVAGIISIIVAIAAPTWFRQREISRARACQENLAKIDAAKEQYALEFKASNGSSVSIDQLVVPPGSEGINKAGFLQVIPKCPGRGTYTPNPIGEDPTCSIGRIDLLDISHAL